MYFHSPNINVKDYFPWIGSRLFFQAAPAPAPGFFSKRLRPALAPAPAPAPAPQPCEQYFKVRDDDFFKITQKYFKVYIYIYSYLILKLKHNMNIIFG